jgi:hypothetical protein
VLHADHDDLQRLAATVLDGIVGGSRADVSETVTMLQARVLAHLANEEEQLLPAYALHAPEDAAAIRLEHDAIRKRLTELDISTDLHLLRADAMKDLLGKLALHAARENAGLYRWAQGA